MFHIFHHQTPIYKPTLVIFLTSFVILTILGLLVNQSKYQTYIFLTVAPSQFDFKQVPQPELNSFYLVSAANIFAETVQGWVNAPTFIDEVNSTAKEGVNPDTEGIITLPWIKAKKESQQNLIIFFPSANKKPWSVPHVIKTLEKRIGVYNTASTTKFSLINNSYTTIDTKLSLAVLFALIAFASLAFSLTFVAYKKINTSLV